MLFLESFDLFAEQIELTPTLGRHVVHLELQVYNILLELLDDLFKRRLLTLSFHSSTYESFR